MTSHSSGPTRYVAAVRRVLIPWVAVVSGCALVSDADLATRLDSDGDGVPRPTDCDDADAALGAPTELFADADADGFGGGKATPNCSAVTGFVPDGSDCNDTDPAINVDATELCDDVDNNCDGDVDESTAADASIWYADGDSDTYGDVSAPQTACYQPTGFVANNADCDDDNVGANPGEVEACGNTADEDCSGAPDQDCDDDGHDAIALGGDDCDDASVYVNPDENEACGDDIDNNCDGELAGSCAFAGDVPLGDASVIITGVRAGDYAGEAVCGGDLNADGFSDVVVSSLGAGFLGEADIFFGPLTGDLSTRDADAVVSASANNWVGTYGNTVTDLDGDGTNDLTLGAQEDPGGFALYAVFGPMVGAYQPGDVDLKLYGVGPNDGFGFEQSATGDTDGDGIGDLLVSASNYGDHQGGASLILGNSRGAIVAAEMIVGAGVGGYNAGQAVAGGGDINGDGLNDIAIAGAYDGTNIIGATYIFFGPVTATSLTASDARLNGVIDYAVCGWSLAIPGDTNMDGYADVLVGCRNGAGDVVTPSYVVDGPISGEQPLSIATAVVSPESGHGGSQVASAGDVDGNGTPDLLFGSADGSEVVPGDAYVVLTPVTGAVSLADAAGRFRGEAVDDRAGLVIGTAGDVNGDTYDDFLISAIKSDRAYNDAGAAYLIYGGED